VFYGDLYPNGECYDATTAEGLRLLMRARRDHAHGSSKDYFEHPSFIGFVRMGDDSRSGCVVIISKSNGKTKFVRMTLTRGLFTEVPPFLGPLPNHGAL
jgi:alpha-amylase